MKVTDLLNELEAFNAQTKNEQSLASLKANHNFDHPNADNYHPFL
jgi:hypothetical protein